MGAPAGPRDAAGLPRRRQREQRGRPGADAHGLAPGLSESAEPLLERYIALLLAWNARTNLTGARSAREARALLVDPVRPLARLAEGERLLDLGSGNGSPGLVLALLRPELRVTLLEPRARRWTFLREACRELGRRDIEVLRCRYQDYPGPRVESVSVRALAVEWGALERLLVPGGLALLYHAPRGIPPAEAAALPAPPGAQVWRVGGSV